MGSGNYSIEAYSSYIESTGASYKSTSENFANTHLSSKTDVRNFKTKGRVHNTKIPSYANGIGVRQSCENAEHPVSTPIIIALDVTGSMRNTPEEMLKEQFPKIMNKLYDAGVPNPQILFMAIGDHECDDAPIQVTEFESDSQSILPQLQEFYLEGGGGPNDGESYLLAWLVAGYHTELDSFHKRGQKGLLFTIGDEPTLTEISGNALHEFLGYTQAAKTTTAEDALNKAREQYIVKHIHVTNASRHFDSSWNELLGSENVIKCSSHSVADKIAETVIEATKNSKSNVALDSVSEAPVVTTGADNDIDLIPDFSDVLTEIRDI